jgi:hypothetical protein
MTEPVRHHYLPIAAYLHFFATELQPDSVYLYSRGKEPREVGLRDAGVEKFLYSMETEPGQFNQELEKVVTAALDARAVELMEKLNLSSHFADLSANEANLLRDFVSLQMVRTPAFRDSLSRFDLALLHKPEDIDRTAREDIRRFGSELSEPQVEEILKRAHQEVEKIVTGPNYWLVRVGRFLELLDEELRFKHAEIWATENEAVVTSDHPVARDYELGVRNSNLIFPIGKRRVLVFRDRTTHRLSGPLKIDVKSMRPSQAREINKVTIKHAERFLLASVKRYSLRILFDRTYAPTRMMPS